MTLADTVETLQVQCSIQVQDKQKERVSPMFRFSAESRPVVAGVVAAMEYANSKTTLSSQRGCYGQLSNALRSMIQADAAMLAMAYASEAESSGEVVDNDDCVSKACEVFTSAKWSKVSELYNAGRAMLND